MYTTAGSAGWTALLVYAGYALGRNLEQAGRYLDPATTVVLVAVVLLSLWRFARGKGSAGTRPGSRIHRGFGSWTGSAHTLESTMRWR